MNTTKVLKAVLPVVVIVLGVLGLRALILSKPDAPRVAADTRALLVDVQPVTRARHEVSVRANGTVIAAEQVVLAPEINGRVVWTNDQLVPGGRFRRGETVFRIDPRDYRLAVDAQSAEVQRAQLEVQLEEGRQRVAEREWNLFESTRGRPPRTARRDPRPRRATTSRCVAPNARPRRSPFGPPAARRNAPASRSRRRASPRPSTRWC